MDVISDKAIIVDDLNGHVEKSKESDYPIDPYGENINNNNGQRIDN